MTLRRSAGFVLAFCLWLIPCQTPPLIPSGLNWARLAGALIAAGAAAFAMRGRRIPEPTVPHRRIHRLRLAFVVGAASFLLVYYFFVFHISTGEGAVAVPVGFGSNCCDQLPNKDCLRQKLILSFDAVRRCWRDSIYAVHLGLIVTYWWTAGAGGALVGLLLFRWGSNRSGPLKITSQGEAPPLPAPEWAYDLFLSYANEDRAFVARLARDLQERGFVLWWDQSRVGAGDSIAGSINEGLARSRQFAVVLSPESRRSHWVDRETSAAIALEGEHLERGRGHQAPFLIPILYGACEIPPLLKDKRRADFTRSYDQGISELLEQLLPPSGHLQA